MYHNYKHYEKLSAIPIYEIGKSLEYLLMSTSKNCSISVVYSDGFEIKNNEGLILY